MIFRVINWTLKQTIYLLSMYVFRTKKIAFNLKNKVRAPHATTPHVVILCSAFGASIYPLSRHVKLLSSYLRILPQESKIMKA